MLEERDAIQRNLGRLERWDTTNLMKFHEAECKVLHMCQGNPGIEISQGNLVAAFQYLKGAHKKPGEGLFYKSRFAVGLLISSKEQRLPRSMKKHARSY